MRLADREKRRSERLPNLDARQGGIKIRNRTRWLGTPKSDASAVDEKANEMVTARTAAVVACYWCG